VLQNTGAASRSDRAFLGHPRGLAYLAATEGWITFSYYGMQSLLILYMTGQLLKPAHIGHVWGFGPFRTLIGALYGATGGQPLAAGIMGLYSALIYATPILGGLVADRLLGRTRTIVLGCVLMTLGHFLMAFDATFLIALACLIAGTGCAGALKAQVGGLYDVGDMRRSDAFQIYTLAVQLSVIVAPLVCGTLGEKIAWHWGFGAAGIGMAVGLLVYGSGRRWLPADPGAASAAAGAHRPRMSARDWRTVGVLALLAPVLAVTAVGNMEIFNGYLVWGKANYQLSFFGQTIPVSWLLSLDALVSTVTLLATVAFWRWWAARAREPDEIVKMAIGAAISALAPLILAAASLQAAGGHKVGLPWGVAFHVVNDLGFANLYGIGLALYSRAAPPAAGATVVNAYMLNLFLSNLLVGWLAGLLSKMSAVNFWLMHAGLVAAGAVALFIFARVFRRTLAPTAAAPPGADPLEAGPAPWSAEQAAAEEIAEQAR
jgi:POT family proton-dependent oligopeptide transporter